MTLSARQKRRDALIERQGGRCGCGCGVDLWALLKAPKAFRAKYVRRGHAAVQVDHIVPLSLGGADDDANTWALTDWCHAAKTAGERGEYRRAAPSVWNGVLAAKPRAEHRPASKAMRLRGKVPAKLRRAG